MDKEYRFSNQSHFISKIQELLEGGVPRERIHTFTPIPVAEVEDILKLDSGGLRNYALGGAIGGFALSFALMIYTVLQWPLPVGGKPLVSIPAFLIVAFECTILAGGIFSFLGFLKLSRLPKINNIIKPEREMENDFIIVVRGVS